MELGGYQEQLRGENRRQQSLPPGTPRGPLSSNGLCLHAPIPPHLAHNEVMQEGKPLLLRP